MKKIILASMCLVSSTTFAIDRTKHTENVGRRVVTVDNTYISHFRPWNLGINAFILPAGVMALSASYAFVHNVAARVGFSFETTDPKDMRKRGKWEKRNSVSVGIPIYMKQAYEGFFVEPGVSSRYGVYAAGGYHWMWESGVNFMAGARFSNKLTVGVLQIAYAL